MRYAWVPAVMLVLAGCAEESAPADDGDFDDFDLDASEGKGVIRGVVVDASVVPIDGATVQLGGEDGPTVTTNQDGAFGFGDVDPGIHRLIVDKLGYASVQQQVTVEAGVKSPPVVKVMLERDASEEPNVQPLYFKGYIDCSVSTPAYRVALCTIADATGSMFRDNFMFVHEGQVADPAWIQAEMMWQGTQPAGDAMLFTMEADASDGGEIAPQATGESPLVIAANQTMVENSRYAGSIMHRVFNYEHPATTPPVPICGIPNYIHGGTMCAKGMGATIQQDFEIYTHVFYRFTPTAGWQFSVDGSPEVPDF